MGYAEQAIEYRFRQAFEPSAICRQWQSTGTQLQHEGGARGLLSRAGWHARLRESLQKLGRSSVDLYLIHNPKGGMLLETWAAMLEAKRQGLALSVGVSNFGLEQMEALASSGLELPEVNQIELHPLLAQGYLKKHRQMQGFVFTKPRQLLCRVRIVGWRRRMFMSSGSSPCRNGPRRRHLLS